MPRHCSLERRFSKREQPNPSRSVEIACQSRSAMPSCEVETTGEHSRASRMINFMKQAYGSSETRAVRFLLSKHNPVEVISTIALEPEDTVGIFPAFSLSESAPT